MQGNQKFYLCRHCGNLAGLIQSSGVPMVCCGEPMAELTANTTDAAQEKHVPVIEADGKKVRVIVGEVLHPMADEHSIQWIYLQTEHGGQRRGLRPGEKPEAVFCVEEDKPVAAFAYCDLHGLWKADVK